MNAVGLNTLPVPFILHYWDFYADGYESPSYIRYDRNAEYGCSRIEYANMYGDTLFLELKNWLLENKTIEDIESLLGEWIGVVRGYMKLNEEYYTRTLADIAALKTKL